jgi:hypothetical protein
MHLHPRGPLSTALLDLLGGAGADGVDSSHGSGRSDRVDELAGLAVVAVQQADDLVDDDDVQLALYLLHELHYSGRPVSGTGRPPDGPDWEWHPELLRCRHVLSSAFERQLRATYARNAPGDLADVPAVLFAMARGDLAHDSTSGASANGRRLPTSVPSFIARQATLEQLREILVLRSPYQLKEADPHTFAIPRLRGRAKAALVEIQVDEYGGGHADRMHAELFARSMRSVGLDDRPNGYLDAVPAVVLAAVNALSHFALHRRLRGALCGHLAAFEMTSSLPAKRYVSGMQRLGLGEDAWLFFDEHVEADAVHEQIAASDLCGGLLGDEPELGADVLLGASVCLGLDARVSEHVLSAWAGGRSALRTPVPDVDVTAIEMVPTPAPLHLLRDDAPIPDDSRATG